MKVLITAPLRQDVEVFNAYQDALDNLIIPDGVEVHRFFVVNDDEKVIPFIRGSYEVMNTGDLYQKTSNDHLWTHDNLTKMHALRNRTVKKMLDGGFDYWFSVDTDVILHPMTLKTLIEADKDIVSEIFWTKHWCNAWLCDQASGMLSKWKEPGLYEVGMTGACTLVKRKVFEAGADYTPIPCIQKVLWGEDRHFCIRATCLGFSLWVDTHYPAEHLFTPDQFKEWKERHDAIN